MLSKVEGRKENRGNREGKEDKQEKEIEEEAGGRRKRSGDELERRQGEEKHGGEGSRGGREETEYRRIEGKRQEEVGRVSIQDKTPPCASAADLSLLLSVKVECWAVTSWKPLS